MIKSSIICHSQHYKDRQINERTYCTLFTKVPMHFMLIDKRGNT